MHLEASLPVPPDIFVPKDLPENWEVQIPISIGKIQTQEKFPELYKSWLINHPNELLAKERFAWLSCLAYYVKMDTNKNGIPDWSAIADNQPTHILFPQDPDIDGDGVPNILDPSPLDAKIKTSDFTRRIPHHLEMDSKMNPAAFRVQARLYKEYGIIAVNHTDQHSSVVLNEFLKLLETAFPKHLASNLKGLRYIYAFLGHNSMNNIAAYHKEASAISIGGQGTYAERDLSKAERVDLVAALAHEVGHAYLLEKLSALELAHLAERFGGWRNLTLSSPTDHYSQIFFLALPFQYLNRNLENQEIKARNIVSQYAMTNIHEWFAESFSATILTNLGLNSYFGKGEWRKFLRKTPKTRTEYWSDFNNVSEDFRHWLNSMLFN